MVLRLFRLTAIQQQDLYDLMVNDKEVAERQNYGVVTVFCHVTQSSYLFIYLFI